MTHRKFGRHRDRIDDYRNGSASDVRDTIWPCWLYGIAAVAVVAIVVIVVIGMWDA